MADTGSYSNSGCQYMRVTCAKTGCTEPAIHVIREKTCSLGLAHSVVCYHNFRGVMLAHNMRVRIPTLQKLESPIRAKSGDTDNSYTTHNMKVFCPAHIYHHKALPGPRKARDLECFVDFWMDYAYDSLASTIRHPELWDELSFNKPTKFNERRKSKKSSDGSGYDAGVDVLDPTDGEKSRNSEQNYDEESCDGGQSGDGDVGAPHEEMDDSPRKLDAQQFKKMFREYAAELLLDGIAFERS